MTDIEKEAQDRDLTAKTLSSLVEYHANNGNACLSLFCVADPNKPDDSNILVMTTANGNLSAEMAFDMIDLCSKKMRSDFFKVAFELGMKSRE